MEIRAATVEDAPGIISCVIESFRDYMLVIGRTPGPMLEDYYEAILRHHVFVAVEDRALLGVILLKDGDADHMLLDVLATFPSLQGKGVGRALIAYGEEYMKSRGIKECRLYTHVKYERTAALYHHLGYETYKRVQEYGFDRYYMKKVL